MLLFLVPIGTTNKCRERNHKTSMSIFGLSSCYFFIVPIGTTNICRELLRFLELRTRVSRVLSSSNHETSLQILVDPIGTKKNNMNTIQTIFEVLRVLNF